MRSASATPSTLVYKWYRHIALVLFGGSTIVGVFVLVRSFSGTMDFGLLVWVLGMAAFTFGVAFSVLAGWSFLHSDGDQLDVRSVLGLIVLTIGSVSTIGWSGFVAAGMLLAGWLIARAGRRTEDSRWRQRNAERLAFYDRVRRSDPRSDPDAARFLDAPPPDGSRDGPSSRQAAIDRARRMDSDPWQVD